MSERSAHEWLDRTQAIAEKATGGAWEWVPSITTQARHRPAKVSTLVWDRDDAVEAALPHSTADAAFIAHARTALPQAVAALRAVLRVHWPDEFGDAPGEYFCNECQRAQMNGVWPCPTITAITDAIGGQP